MAYTIKFGDAEFEARDFKLHVDTKRSMGSRPALDSTEVQLELWVDSNEKALPTSARSSLFKYARAPKPDDLQVSEVQIPNTVNKGQMLCTYSFERGWISEFREYQRPGDPTLTLHLNVRAFFAERPTSEIKVA